MSRTAESPPERAAAPGTRPQGVRDEREAAKYVREMFSRIAPRYDLLNHLLSLNLDKLWRRRAARRFRHVLMRGDARVLDLCCGTGDLALALANEAESVKAEVKRSTQRTQSGTEWHRGAEVWGSDFAHPMLVRAKEKARAREGTVAETEAHRAMTAIRFVEADALRLPFADARFDLVTAAFGFRNLANYEAGLSEIYRVLKPGGEVGILEFAAPQSGVLGALYRMYFTQILPRVGGAVSGSRAAYSYLPASVANFPEPEELQAHMRGIGFTDTRSELWTLGIVALHTAQKI